MVSNSQSCKQYQRMWTVAIVLLISMMPVFVLDAASATNPTNVSSDGRIDPLEDVSKDAMFQAAATIAGLAIFGSAISIRIHRKPETRNPQWWAQVFTYVGITLLVATQGIFMLFACCTNTGVELVFEWILATTVLLIAIAVTLTVALSVQEDERQRAYNSLFEELEFTKDLIEKHRKDASDEDYKLPVFTNHVDRFFNHDIYDSLVETGLIFRLDYGQQQLIQKTMRNIKRHNKYLQKSEELMKKASFKYIRRGKSGETISGIPMKSPEMYYVNEYHLALYRWEGIILEDIKEVLAKNKHSKR